MNRDRLPAAQMEMRQRMTQPWVKKRRRCFIPDEWRYTLTVALRALIVKCHNEGTEHGCQRALECARELGLDVELVGKYTHLEKKEVSLEK